MPLACARCHVRKIKCDSNKPSCGQCKDAGAECQPHERRRRRVYPSRDVDLEARLQWLETELRQHLHVDVRRTRTGSSLKGLLAQSTAFPQDVRSTAQEQVPPSHEKQSTAFPSIAQATSSPSLEATPDISLLTLNATGETRYLGPSGGSYFAQYAANFARALAVQDRQNPMLFATRLNDSAVLERSSTSENRVSEDPIAILTPAMAKHLLDCYFQWVHPLIPIVSSSMRQTFMETLASAQGQDQYSIWEQEVDRFQLVIYYLILALGAVHSHCVTENFGTNEGYAKFQNAVSMALISSDSIYTKAVDILSSTPPTTQPSVSFIQVLLLICTYGGYRPSGNRQWQLCGMAVRLSIELGLHRERQSWNLDPDELDIRRRVFWAVYALEITIAFNLGRPPSVTEEHIDAQFPEITSETSLMIYHVRHRQIQSTMLREVYCVPSKLQNLTTDERQSIITGIQLELDAWRDSLQEIYDGAKSKYPPQYWGRLYYSTIGALYRPNPLVSNPTTEGTRRCLNATGRFIDIYHHILKTSSVPLSWMLLQGTVLSIITVLVTARTNGLELLREGATSIPVIIEWNRKCSVILAIISERWPQTFIKHLETQINSLASDTVQQLIQFQSAIEKETDKGRLEQASLPSQNSHQIRVTNVQGDKFIENAASGLLPVDTWGQHYFDDFAQSDQNWFGSINNDIYPMDELFRGDELFDYYNIFPMDGF